MIRLPRSGATVCEKPGETLTADEIAALDEYFVAVRAAVAKDREPEVVEP